MTLLRGVVGRSLSRFSPEMAIGGVAGLVLLLAVGQLCWATLRPHEAIAPAPTEFAAPAPAAKVEALWTREQATLVAAFRLTFTADGELVPAYAVILPSPLVEPEQPRQMEASLSPRGLVRPDAPIPAARTDVRPAPRAKAAAAPGSDAQPLPPRRPVILADAPLELQPQARRSRLFSLEVPDLIPSKERIMRPVTVVTGTVAGAAGAVTDTVRDWLP
jgi:hypothetical protein